MDPFIEGMAEILVWIISSVVAMITGAIAVIINRKKVRSVMDTMDYSSHKEKKKNIYNRSEIVDQQILMKIKENDKNFDETVFKEWARETFVEFNKAWTNKNIKVISARLDKNLCEQYELLLDANIQEGCKNIIDIKQINFIDFYSYSKDDEKEIIEVAINVVLLDYVINETNNKIVSGSKTTKIRTTYKLNFYRKNGTMSDDIQKEKHCPNCGGKISTEDNKCKYCNTTVLNSVQEWLLNNIEKY